MLFGLAVLGAGSVPRGESDVKPGGAVIFVLDAFDGGENHGQDVSDVAARACLHRCGIRKISLGTSVDRERYLDAMSDVLAYAQVHPETRIVVNMSFGSYRPDERERLLVRAMIDRGIVVVAAAGNDDTDVPMYPAGYDGVIAVAAINGDVKAGYSNYGSHVLLGAEGFLRSQVAKREDRVRGSYREESVTWLIHGGTSFAAPRVSGFCGYVLSRRPDLPAAELKRLLRQTARPLRDDYRFVLGKLGAGRLSEFGVLYAVDPGFRQLVWSHLSGWIPFLAIWSVACVRGWRRGELFAPAVEGIFLAVLIVVLQSVAVWTWGEVQGRVAGIGIWAAAGVVWVIVLVVRWRERVFVRDYVLDEETLQRVTREDPVSGARHLRRGDVVLLLIRERGIRPDLAERIVDKRLDLA